jgi:RHS repeat-associated protein
MYINKSFIVLVFSFFTLFSFAQQEEAPVDYKQGNELLGNPKLKVEDSRYLDLNDKKLFVSVNDAVSIHFGFNDDVSKIAAYNEVYDCTITLLITPYDNSGHKNYSYTENGQLVSHTEPYPVTLTITHNNVTKGIRLNDYLVYKLPGIHKADVEVASITYSAPGIHSSPYLALKFNTDRYYNLQNTTVIPTAEFVRYEGTNPTKVNAASQGADELLIKWNANAESPALEYELEWTWIDNFGAEGVKKLAADISLTEKEFMLNSTRIQTKETSYRIPIVFSSGYIIYRVRAVGRFLDDINKVYNGKWSISELDKPLNLVNDWTNIEIDQSHESGGKNWQYQASFAENGKKKEVVSYFDGSLRNRQTVTKVNSDNKAIVGEVIYDNQGRAAIEVLPTPLQSAAIRFYRDLNKNTKGFIYTHKDFDWDLKDSIINCTPILVPTMANGTGAGKYYSPNNAESNNFQDFVPDAQGYPFSQIEYTPDNTGRIKSKGGVGVDHQIGKGHEMRYFYSQPSQEELNRLFGYKVGNYSHYKKNTVIDPNGQVSVSYLDPQGRTVATALAGDKEGSLDALEEEKTAGLHIMTTTDLLSNNDPYASGDNGTLKDGIKLNSTIGVVKSGAITFNYSFDKTKNAFTDACLNGKFYPFVYDLSLNLKNECAEELLVGSESAPLSVKIGEFSLSATSSPALSVSNKVFTALDGDKFLRVGAYGFSKDLRINRDDLNSYADDYIKQLKDNKICLPDLSALEADVTAADCNITCKSCEEALVRNNLTTEDYTSFQSMLSSDNKLGNVSLREALIIKAETKYVETNMLTIQELKETERANYENGFKFEFRGLLKGCRELCEQPVNVCDLNLQMLLRDVSPHGQYGSVQGIELDVEDADVEANPDVDAPPLDRLSVFNINNDLSYKGFHTETYRDEDTGADVIVKVSNINWKAPFGGLYKDEDGTPSLIKVKLISEVPGKPEANVYEPALEGLTTKLAHNTESDDPNEYLVEPTYLRNVADFVRLWRNSWANSLVQYHPEYQYYAYNLGICNKINSDGTNSNGFDAKLLEKEFYDAETKKIADTDDSIFRQGGLLEQLLNLDATTDPFYNSRNTFGNETEQDFTLRKDIMREALTASYDGMTTGGKKMNMLQVAYYFSVFSNGIAPETAYTEFMSWTQTALLAKIRALGANGNIVDLNTKQRIWANFQSYYIGIKAKTSTVFAHIEAIKNNNYNECIGNPEGSDNFVTLLNKYTANETIQQLIASTPDPDAVPVPNVPASTGIALACSDELSPLFAAKEKRFIAADYGYDSSMGDMDILASAQAEADTKVYLETGKSPGYLALENFLKGLVDPTIQDQGLVIKNGIPVTSMPFLTRSLFDAQINLNFNLHASNEIPKIVSAFDASSNILSIGFTRNNSPISTPITLQFVNAANHVNPCGGEKTLNWADIVDFKNLYYVPNSYDKVLGTYEFQIIATIKRQGTPTTCTTPEEVLLQGVTKINIADYYPANTFANCGKQEKFSDAFNNLILALQRTNTLRNSNVDITANASFAGSYLYEYFGIKDGENVSWNNSGTNANISVNGEKRLSLDFTGHMLGSRAISKISIANLLNNNSNLVKIKLRGLMGLRQINGQITAGKARRPLYFLCCSPCGEDDFNGDGIGDKCDSNGSCGVIDTDGDGIFDDCDNCKYTKNPDQRDTDGDGVGDSCDSISPNPCGTIDTDGDGIFDDCDNCKDTPNSDQKDSNNNGVGDVCDYPCGKIDKDGDGIFDLCDNCKDIPNPDQKDIDNDGIGDVCDINRINTCNINLEVNYEDNLRDVFNEAIENNAFGISKISANNVNVNKFITELGLVEKFQVARNKYLEFEPETYNTPIQLSSFSVEKIKLQTGTSTVFQLLFKNGEQKSDASILLLLNANTVKKINYIDIATPILANVYYTDLNNVARTGRVTLVNNINFDESLGAAELTCDFLNYKLSSLRMASRSAKSNSILAFRDTPYYESRINADGTLTMIEHNVTSPGSTSVMSLAVSEEICPKICVPAIPEPVVCNEKWTQFKTDMGTLLPDYVLAKNLNDNGTYFCEANFGYISDDYGYYLGKLKTLKGAAFSSSNALFLDIDKFGATRLHYGNKDTRDVIDKYFAYLAGIIQNPVVEALTWNQYADKYVVDFQKCVPAVMIPRFSLENENPIKLTPCELYTATIKAANKQQIEDSFYASKREEFIQNYTKEALEEITEILTKTALDKEYQYTLYYYDQAGNLIQTVPPEGVHRLAPTSDKSIDTVRNNDSEKVDLTDVNGIKVVPQNDLQTQYRYNSLNQLVWQQTPDGGITKFAYDPLGRIIASQNAKQKDLSQLSYTRYDKLGRIMEAGQLKLKTTAVISELGRLVVSELPKAALINVDAVEDHYPYNIAAKTEQVTKTVYDIPLANSESWFTDYGVNNTQKRVTAILYFDELTEDIASVQTSTGYNNAILYDYDIHGNVKELIHHTNNNSDLTIKNQQLKKVVYAYDLISGNVNKVTYQPGKTDQFIHKYDYDADNRIKQVYTSKDNTIWEKEANYLYYEHGPLARVEIGDKAVQGIDYIYTLQGWLKGVNSEELKSRADAGSDGLNVAKDAFGFALNYYKGDYISRINNKDASVFTLSRTGNFEGDANLYNGNIKEMVTSLLDLDGNPLASQFNHYTYDQLNRITNMNSEAIVAGVSKPSYKSNYSYDKNGNLLTMSNYTPKKDGSIAEMDNLTYNYIIKTNLDKDPSDPNYKTRTNQLQYVKDLVGAGVFTNNSKNLNDTSLDIDNQESDNYTYDAIGQLISDKLEGITIDWRVDGKVNKVTKNNGTVVSFEYDGLGNRTSKKVVTPTSATVTYYERDAQGNVLSTYEMITANGVSNYYLVEQSIYGSSRLGIEQYEHSKKISEETFTAFAGKSSLMTARSAVATLSEASVPETYGLKFDTKDDYTSWTVNSDDKLNLFTNKTVKTKTVTLSSHFKIDPSNDNRIVLALHGSSTEGSFPKSNSYSFRSSVLLTIKKELTGYVPTISLLKYRRNHHDYTRRAKKKYSFRSYLEQIDYKMATKTQAVPENEWDFNATIKYNLKTAAYDVVITLNGNVYSTVPVSKVLLNGDQNENLKRNDGRLKIITPSNRLGYTEIENRPGQTDKYPALITEMCDFTYNIDNGKGTEPLKINAFGFDEGDGETATASTGATMALNSITSPNHVDYDHTFCGLADNDRDADGKIDKEDICPDVFNPKQEDTAEVALGYSPDGVGDVCDNCVYPNPLQTDTDGDGKGDDVEVNGIMKQCDNCKLIPNFDQKDSDGDKVGDVCDNCKTINNPLQEDANHNGIGDACEGLDQGIGETTVAAVPETSNRYVGDKRYELSNHLGNVLSVISDRKLIRLANEPIQETIQEYDFTGWASIKEDNKWLAVGNLSKITTDTNKLVMAVGDSGNGVTVSLLTTAGKKYTVSYDLDLISSSEVLVKATNFGDIINQKTDRVSGRQSITFTAAGVVSMVQWNRTRAKDAANVDDVYSLDNVSIAVESTENTVAYTTFSPDIFSYSDYYPFGMLVPNRHKATDGYRYGFNGKENDNEVMGEGNFQDYGMRMYNPRISRFFNVDPLTKQYPELTPYQFASNTPIQAIDMDGLEAWVAIWATQSKDTDGDKSPQIGHTGIVLQNYEKIIDKQGKVSYKSMGTYTYYDHWPGKGADLGGKGATQNQPPVYQKQGFVVKSGGKITEEHKSLENYISKHDISQLPSIVNGQPEDKERGEGYAPDGIIRVDITPEQTYNLQQNLNNQVKGDAQYNGLSHNCTTFVAIALNSTGDINVSEESINDWRGFIIGSFSAYTPNETYKQLTTTPNADKTTVIKDASNKTKESYEDAIIDR